MQCVILAGGLGTRMRAVSGDIPKSLISVHEKPFIAYQLQWLKRCAVRDVLLCVGYGGDQIRAAVGHGEGWGLHVDYVEEKEALRGTGGALRLAGDQAKLQSTFFLMYGDSFLPIDFSALETAFQDRAEPALMTVLRNAGQWDKSNASFDGTRVTCYDKKKAPAQGFDFIDYGLSLLRRDPLMKEIPADTTYDLADYFSALSDAGRLAGYEIHERFYEIGSPRGLADFKAYVAQKSRMTEK